MSLSRADRSLITDWWFTVDRTLLFAIGLLIGIGLVVMLAASPAMALKQNRDAFFYVERQVLFAAGGVALMFAVSLLSPRWVRRVALLSFFGGVGAMVAALLVGPEWNGAHRWLPVAGFAVQPSEFAKPAFVVLSAWALSERLRRPDMPTVPIIIGLFLLLVVPLRLQPDIGQMLLVSAVWGGLLVLAGLPLIVPAALATVGGVVLSVGYFAGGYFRDRIDRFLSGELPAGSQAERAIQSFVEGGFLGRGPGAGSIKTALPDAHTDFIFAVIAEEYGVVACLFILGVFALVVMRLFVAALAHRDRFSRFALVGLALLIGGQALLHMAVNTGLAPTTGVTLPLISAGGSSYLATCLAIGMALAIARTAPRSRDLHPSAFAATPAAANR
jgi:cell division protein FtsW